MSDSSFNTYFIVDDVERAAEVIDALKAQNVSEDDIGVVSEDKKFAVADLPQIDLTEKSRVSAALKRGALLGSGSGLLAGVLIATFPPSGVAVGGAALVGMTVGGAAFGAWSSSMIGISENSELVKKFESALHNDKTLIFAELTDAQKSDLGSKVSNIVAGEIK